MIIVSIKNALNADLLENYVIDIKKARLLSCYRQVWLVDVERFLADIAI